MFKNQPHNQNPPKFKVGSSATYFMRGFQNTLGRMVAQIQNRYINLHGSHFEGETKSGNKISSVKIFKIPRISNQDI